VTYSDYPQVLQALLAGQDAPLDAWYADPLPPAAAGRFARERQAARRRAAGDRPEDRLLDLLARFHAGKAVEPDYRTLAALWHDDRPAALLELVYGQLLASRGLPGAGAHLDRGFGRAAHLLAPAAYFRVMKRHDLLRLLPTRPQPAAARSLEDLLTEARVIRRLGGGRQSPVIPSPHGDTID